MKRALILFLMLLAAPVRAETYDDLIRAELRPGWMMANGDHMAGLHLSLKPGWKTYWRSPGDAGIPPSFHWEGLNGQKVQVEWPSPKVFWQSSMRSIGYENDVVLPLRISGLKPGQTLDLRGIIDLGICQDICLPKRVHVRGVVDGAVKKPDPQIAAALANLPYSAHEAGVGHVSCQIRPASDGVGLTVQISLPRNKGARFEAVVESDDPEIWAAEPQTRWEGDTLIAQTTLSHMSGGAFALDRSGLRFTLIGRDTPIDIQGCTG